MCSASQTMALDVWYVVFFTNSCLLEVPVGVFAIFFYFFVKDSFGWFLMGRLYKNALSMLVICRASFLVYTNDFSNGYCSSSLLNLNLILEAP